MSNTNTSPLNYLNQYLRYRRDREFNLNRMVLFIAIYLVISLLARNLPLTLRLYLLLGSIILAVSLTEDEVYPTVISIILINYFVGQVFELESFAAGFIEVLFFSLFFSALIYTLRRAMDANFLRDLRKLALLEKMGIEGKITIKNGIITKVNANFPRMISQAKEDLIGQNFYEFVKNPLGNDLELILHNYSSYNEIILHNKDGDVFSFFMGVDEYNEGENRYELSLTESFDLMRKNREETTRKIKTISSISGVALVERDISVLRNELKSQLEGGIESLKQYLDDSSNYQYLLSQIKVTSLNDEAVQLFEASSKEELAEYLQNQPFNAEDTAMSLHSYYERLNSLERESFIITLRGNRKDLLLRSSYPPHNSNTLIVTVIDITRYKEALRNLSESEQRFKTIFESAPIGLIVHDNTYIRYVNEEYVSIYGYDSASELIGQDLNILIPYGDREESDKIGEDRYLGKAPKVYEIGALRKDGAIRSIIVQATLIKIDGKTHTLSFVQDITEQKQLEEERKQIQEQLISSHKLESLGLLAGGIAHDFNNILQVLKGGLEVLNLSSNLTSEDRELIFDLIKSATNAANITSQLLIYTGKSTVDIPSKPSQVLDMVKEVDGVARLSVPNSITMLYDYHIDGKAGILIDPTQFSQIILNLVMNSAQAIDHDRGVITISISKFTYHRDSNDRKYMGTIISKDEIEEGVYVRFAVIDNGSGIPEEKKRSVFDPFYTTKKGGRGLGLSVVQGIALQTGGFLSVSSKIGIGTEISLHLPYFEINEESHLDKETHLADKDILEKGTILVIDDEPMLRMVLKKMLVNLGYDVLLAQDGLEGINQFEHNIDVVDAIILDQVMPNMGGKETFERCIQLKSDIPIIISSGYSEHQMAEFSSYSNISYLQKPYTLKQLKKILKNLRYYTI